MRRTRPVAADGGKLSNSGTRLRVWLPSSLSWKSAPSSSSTPSATSSSAWPRSASTSWSSESRPLIRSSPKPSRSFLSKESLAAIRSDSGPETRALNSRAWKFPAPAWSLASQWSAFGREVVRLTTPPTTFLPKSVPWGPRSTETCSRSKSSKSEALERET